MIKINKTCPYGSECEKAGDGVIERCNLYIKFPMENISTGEVKETYDCSHNWSAIFAKDAALTNRGQTAAIESLRNGMIKKQAEAIETMRDIKQIN